jgi:hypothetical protein
VPHGETIEQPEPLSTEQLDSIVSPPLLICTAKPLMGMLPNFVWGTAVISCINIDVFVCQCAYACIDNYTCTSYLA